jgi:hypothetical protein
MRLTDLGGAAQARVAEPVELDGTTLTVAVGVPVIKVLLDKNVGLIEQALAGRYGGSWTVRVRLDEQLRRPPEPPSADWVANWT